MESWLERLHALTRQGASRWAMVGARLIDGDPNGFAGAGGVLFDDGRIAASGARVRKEALGDAPAVDMGGRFVLPGLVDAHVHLSWDASANPVDTLLGDLPRPDVLRERAQQNALLALRRGTTTLRDLGGPNDVVLWLRDAIRDGRAAGPRMLAAGEVITTPGGHCHFMGRLATGARQAAAAATDQVRLGADVLKVMASGGVHTQGSNPGRAQFKLHSLMAVVLAAHTNGLRVTSHATSKQAIRSAVAAGIDSIQHGARMDGWTMEEMARRGVPLTPTLGTGTAITLHSDDPRIPADVRRKSTERTVSGERVIGFQRAFRAGVPIAAGTDSGTTFVAHGGLPTELIELHRAGLPARASIAAATFVAAQDLGLDDVGSLAPGSAGDVIVIDADPLADLRALDVPSAVLQRGRLVADMDGLVRTAHGRPIP